ncbi:MAG: ATP-binding cassette domain-containing protein [Candidatus Thorarchaeota archaeon]
MEPVLEMENVCKSFVGEGGTEIQANQNVNFTLKPGEIHALLGENGAGKSTLVMNLCREPDSGRILLDGNTVSLTSPKEALENGIGIAYQDLSRTLVERHTVAENILSLSTGFFLSLSTIEELIEKAFVQFNLDLIDPKTPVWKLSGGEKQRVEILKALITNPRILILDEPTSMLTPPEVKTLFALLESLKAVGKSIIIITHHLEEAIEISDRITVLRKGQVVETIDESRVEEMKNSPVEGRRELARLMVGKDVLYDLKRHPLDDGPTKLRISKLIVNNDMGMQVVNSVNLEVKSNQVVGLAGIAGNGQRELVESIVHWRSVESGSIEIDDQDVTNKSTREIRNLGVAFIPENRKKALIPDLSVRENLLLSYYDETEGFFMDRSELVAKSDELIERYAIETPSPLTPVRSLSGGNRQKVVVARELSRRTAGSPTRVREGYEEEGRLGKLMKLHRLKQLLRSQRFLQIKSFLKYFYHGFIFSLAIPIVVFLWLFMLSALSFLLGWGLNVFLAFLLIKLVGWTNTRFTRALWSVEFDIARVRLFIYNGFLSLLLIFINLPIVYVVLADSSADPQIYLYVTITQLLLYPLIFGYVCKFVSMKLGRSTIMSTDQDAGLLLIAENPTFGLDVATTQFVREEILNTRNEGTAVLLVSSDLTEILTLSDVIAVIYKGKIIGVLKSEDATREAVGLLMGGVVPGGLPGEVST